MPRVQCSYCGLPFRVRQVEAGRAYYCCSGCALASRLPPAGEGGQFPVTPALIVALGVGFAFFNEVLFWTLALAPDPRPPARRRRCCLPASRPGWGVLVWAAVGARHVARGGAPLDRCRGGGGDAGGHRGRDSAEALGGVRGGGQRGAGALAGARLGQAKIHREISRLQFDRDAPTF